MLKETHPSVHAENLKTLKRKGLSEREATLVSMKEAKTKGSEAAEAPSVAKSEGDSFPYGLRLDLNHETLRKLGHKTPPAAGSTVTIHAKAKVVHTSTHTEADGTDRHSADLQITHMKTA